MQEFAGALWEFQTVTSFSKTTPSQRRTRVWCRCRLSTTELVGEFPKWMAILASELCCRVFNAARKTIQRDAVPSRSATRALPGALVGDERGLT
jgi:hypothetical protein